MPANARATAASTFADNSFYGMLFPAAGERLQAMASRRTYSQGSSLMLEGDLAGYVIVLLRGWAKAASSTPIGYEIVLRIYGPGDLFGGETILGTHRSESVVALTECHSLLLRTDQFTDLLADDASIARAFNRTMVLRVQAADQQVRARFDLPIVRLSRILLDLAARAGVKGDSGITIPVELSQEELASLIGASRSTVSRMLNKLRREGVIRTGYRRITITDAEWLNGTARTSSW